MFTITQYKTPSVAGEQVSKPVNAGETQVESGQNDTVAGATTTGARLAGGRDLNSLLSLGDDRRRSKPRYDADTYSGAAVDPYADVEMQSKRDNSLVPALLIQCPSSTIALPVKFNRTHKHMDDKVGDDHKLSLTGPAQPEPPLRRLSQGIVAAASQVLPARLVSETKDEWHRRIDVLNKNRLHIDNSVAARRRERSNSRSDEPV